MARLILVAVLLWATSWTARGEQGEPHTPEGIPPLAGSSAHELRLYMIRGRGFARRWRRLPW
jgi:hypothetical protein